MRPAVEDCRATGVGAYDPEGDRSENDGDARLATDGNRATAWKSERYRSSFTKSGVGLVLDAGTARQGLAGHRGRPRAPATTAQVRVGDVGDKAVRHRLGAKTTTPRTIFALRPRSGRYLMLWITSMPASGTAAVNEITVDGAAGLTRCRSQLRSPSRSACSSGCRR